VSITGRAGTGKTIIATAIGYYLVERTKAYNKLLVSRPVFPMGRDIGYLPGGINSKLDPWMQPIYDALEKVINKKGVDGRQIVFQSQGIYVEPLTYIRGRSIHDQFVIIDEAQNLTPLELKTIITRAGEHTKVILTGDISQIDNPYIDERSNGLSVVTRAFIDSPIAANIVLSKGVRSTLSKEATERL
jgi:PhoH-like ATPase